MAVLKYKDPETGEVKKVGNPVVDAYTKGETDAKINTAKNEAIASANASANAHAENKNNPHGVTASQIGAAPAYTYGTTDMTPGVTPLETGKLYFVYE